MPQVCCETIGRNSNSGVYCQLSQLCLTRMCLINKWINKSQPSPSSRKTCPPLSITGLFVLRRFVRHPLQDTEHQDFHQVTGRENKTTTKVCIYGFLSWKPHVWSQSVRLSVPVAMEVNSNTPPPPPLSAVAPPRSSSRMLHALPVGMSQWL